MVMIKMQAQLWTDQHWKVTKVQAQSDGIPLIGLAIWQDKNESKNCEGPMKTHSEDVKTYLKMWVMRWQHILLCMCVLFIALFQPVSSQGHFPPMENIAAFKPVSTSSARSTCGVPDRSVYCQTAFSQAELYMCQQASCDQECPYRSSTPPYAPLLLPAYRGTCVTEDSKDTHPIHYQTSGLDSLSTSMSSRGSPLSGSVVFPQGQQECLVSPPSQKLGLSGSLTLALWIKPSSLGEMTLLEKKSKNQLVFSLTVSEQIVSMKYSQDRTSTPMTVNFRTEGRLVMDRWTHIVLQVHDKHASLFLNGLEEDGTPFDTQYLVSRLYDINEDSTMRVGLSSEGSNQFMGRMQDFRFYPSTLTNREIVEIYLGLLPQLHSQSECRCPPTHPRVHPLVERYCIPNAVEDTTNDRVQRLNLNAHPLAYINDKDMGTMWRSKLMMTQELDKRFTITVDLENGQYQVFYVIIQFGGPFPESLLIQRQRLSNQENSTNAEHPWFDWQYMARDCSVFKMKNNGPLLTPDSVNCLQLPSESPYSGGNITVSLLSPEPNKRPGYNNFYNTPILQKMVQATRVRIHLGGQYHTRAAGVDHRHRHYSIKEITISGRCECNGHADQCDTSLLPYRCLCVPESHTEGNNCQRCAPLFNDKPFRPGDQLQPMNCRPCQCHGHANSCHYDAQADDQPTKQYLGGGGVCDNCTHNTMGRNCELCVNGFYRLVQSDPASLHVCQPCNCHISGTVHGTTECLQIGGQCQCKSAVTGRRCSDCSPGWYGLDASNPEGCTRCNCSGMGTISSSAGKVVSCDRYTGQCQCKAHVTGLSCDRCEFGYWNISNADGCIPCDCDPSGSLSPFCEPEGGQCECKPGVGGQRCDSCGPGLTGLRLEGTCTPCNCSEEGTVAGTDCDPNTGQCLCKKHVEGQLCDSCGHGYHTLERRNSLGCLPCSCDITGTVPEGVCDNLTGKCPCREGVEGMQCTNCAPYYFNTSSGCIPCTCDPRGTVSGSVCDGTTGQCVCTPTRHGKNCSACRPGFFLSPDQSICMECDCHPMGAVKRKCESQTGKCICAHPSVGGRRCDRCQETFFGFNPGLGRCQPCACDPVGSLSFSCNSDSGVCECKMLVTGDKCDTCQHGASHLRAENVYGCSKAPSQQPAPLAFALSFSSINLTWHQPDSPNSNILNYTLMRNSQPVHSIQRSYPFSPESYPDTGLSPYTNYSYWLITANIAGETISTTAYYQTLGAPPELDQLHLSLVGRPGPTSASFNWGKPPNKTGPVERFVLSSTESSSGAEPVIHYTGLSTEAMASGLQAFTQYTVTLEACSSGGCTSTLPLSLLTAAAPPQNQSPPKVTATGPHTLFASWEPPSQPNGVITRYELFLRGPLKPHSLSPPTGGKKVFVSTGWLDPTIPSQAPLSNRSTVLPPESSTIVASLQAFSHYQLRVVSVNMAGNVTSGWTTTHTMEGAPELMAPPEVTAVSSTSLKVTWSTSEGQGVIARGQVIEYRVNLLVEQTNNTYSPPVISQVLQHFGPSDQPLYIAKGLKPYHVYNFTVTVCTKKGCITSPGQSGRTQPAAPKGLSTPRLFPVNESTIQIEWDTPAQLNGPHPLYQVERTDVSLSDPRGPFIRGTRFSGDSYYQFPSDTLPVNTDFTGIELSFKTHSPDGLLLCAMSPGKQEEFLAIQIENGRPYFLFDPQGAVVAISAQGDGGRLYNDGKWHHIIARRQGAVGTIVVDNQYRGSSSASSGSTIIGENTGVFIGGLPEDFILRRKDSGAAQLTRQGFSGCLRDVRFKMTDSPLEEWRSLNWTKATNKMSVYESWEGCPMHTVEGAHFLGHGYLELNGDVFIGGNNFEITMEFRTDHLNTLLFFAYHTQMDDFILVELKGGLLSFVLSADSHKTELSMWAGLSYCDGDWKRLSLIKRGSHISASVDDWAEQTKSTQAVGRFRVDSPLYLGGVPIQLAHKALDLYSHRHGFGGCIRGLTIQSDETNTLVSQSGNLNVAFGHSVRVYLDGCPNGESRYNCRGNDSVLAFTGRATHAFDYSLQPFTEYLYRIIALGTGGWAASPWQRGRSYGKVPSSIPAPSSVQILNGFSAKVNWAPPSADVRGVIDRYVLKAYLREQPEMPPVKAVYLANEDFTGILSGLTPATQYVVTLSACVAMGCTESKHNADMTDGKSAFKTPEEAPDGVSAPSTLSLPSSLFVTWKPPAWPNGVIKQYQLYQNNQMVYSGKERRHNITGLGIYTAHVLLLSACTAAGCTNSSKVTKLTSQLPPGSLRAPTLTLLDSRTILVEWTRPSRVNGVLNSYSIFVSEGGEEHAVVHNSSVLVEEHTLRNLTPGMAYNITVVACTGGGCTQSPSAQVVTEESTPEDVPAPLVTALSPHALNVSWTAPATPNGILTSFGLWMNGVLISNISSSQSFLVVKELSPWSKHILRLQACTARGCGKGPMVEANTLEMAPAGPVLLELANQSSRSLRARWTAPPSPNGYMRYTLHYKSEDGDAMLDGGTEASRWLTLTDLHPYTSYSFWVEGCNTRGCVESSVLNATTSPAAPEGLSALRLTRATSTSLNVSWSRPARANAPGPLHYSLQMRTSPQRPMIRLLENVTDTFFYNVLDLSPYTGYLFQLVVSHTHGQTTGLWETLRTAEDRPGPLDHPTVSVLHSCNVTITWAPPLQPNGMIISYGLYLQPGSSYSLYDIPGTKLDPNSNFPTTTSEPNHSNGLQNPESTHVSNKNQGSGLNLLPSLEATAITGQNQRPSYKGFISNEPDTEHQIQQGHLHYTNLSNSESGFGPSAPSVKVSGLTTSYTFLHLLPYQFYNVQLEACTRIGCSVSKTVEFLTLPAPPEGLPIPHLHSDTPTSVLLSWGAPQRSNGVLERWLIERRVTGTDQISTVGHLPPGPFPLSFLDSSSALSPWTSYDYRLVLQNQAGSSKGRWVGITTRPSRPAGVSPPRVKVLGPESLQVMWSPPLIPNGEIQGYDIRLPEPRVFHNGDITSELSVTITDLIPYTNYSVTILVCSEGGGFVGGCTESLPTLGTTLPASPQGLAPLTVVAVSESFLAISWQPPHRPNGPNIRYELLRRKRHQPLAVTPVVPIVTAQFHNPSEDLHRWLHVYSGTKLFYQDKGLSRFTHYQYQLVVRNDMGFTSGEIVSAVTMAGIPLQGPSLSAYAVNHTALYANWTPPSLHSLQGEVESYFLTIVSANSRQNLVFPKKILSTVVTELWPRTTHTVSLHVSNGAHNTTKSIVNVTTLDGEPDGMSAPEVVPVNSSTVRVLWSPPLQPNGVITGYQVYVDDRLHVSVDNTSGSYLLKQLLPLTVYSIQVEVCTVYACARSNITETTTVEDVPADMAPPRVEVLSSRVVKLEWSPPNRPNGIMKGYEVLRRTFGPCVSWSMGISPYVWKKSENGSNNILRCSYLQCPSAHRMCGTSCFHPDQQICCNGTLYHKLQHHYCCAGNYLNFTNSTNPVCCNGNLLPRLPHHHCCGGYYIHLKSDEYCCPDHSQGRVSVGPGDSCCGGAPYATTGGQLCCSGRLHDGYGAQCCGGYIVDEKLVCCGGANQGQVHAYIPGFSCCGQDYINSSTSLCCVGGDGVPTMHPLGNTTVKLQCCGSKVILQEQECCSGVGFDPQRHVCASRPTPGLSIETFCLQGTVCPVSASLTAYCGSCDIDPSTTACTWVLSAHPDTPSVTSSPTIHATSQVLIPASSSHNNISHLQNGNGSDEGSFCPSHEEVIYSGNARKFTYTDLNLEPFTTYEYKVTGWNSFSRASSNVSLVTTAGEKPWGVLPPRWRRLGERNDTIQWHWQAPARPNGIISHYVILRDGQERYRGDEKSFTDMGLITPFQEFSYQLRACNSAGCTDSRKMVAVTVQGVPEGVQSPAIRALSPFSLHMSWVRPASPNGRVQWYHLNQTGVGTICTQTQAPGNYTATGLQPFTDYTFVLVACTAVGCGASSPSTGRTLQASPTGVWSKPRHVIVNTSVVKLFWDQPSRPNGLIFQYKLRRDGRTIFTGNHRGRNFTDAGLLPDRRYVYELEAITGGGTGLSDKHVIKTPFSCPTGIPIPHNVTVSGPHSISLAWTPPARFNISQPVNYNILLNPGSEGATVHPTGQDLNLTVKGLQPFTNYNVHVQACQNEACCVGESVNVRTLESGPKHLSPPIVRRAGASFLEISWSPPEQPNGVITSYHIYRYQVEKEEELLVFIWSSGPLEFFDASSSLQPFTYYQYRLQAYNSKGSVLSHSTLARTLTSEPKDLSPPTATPTGAYSIHLKWSGPKQPNGVIVHYKLLYKKHHSDPTLNSPEVTALTVKGSTLEANLFGLDPDTEYSLQVEAVNEAGSVSSSWVTTSTLEASPSGLANLTVEQKEQGRSLLLKWDPPNTPNGVITMYHLYSDGNLEYSGLLRNFMFRRLEPWTAYTLTLEACTSAGCTRSHPQRVATAAAPSASQPPPTALSVGSDQVSLTWGAPTQPNGPIGEYYLLGRSVDQAGRGRRRDEDVQREKVLFRESSPQENDTFSYTVTGLRPWTQYEFAVRSHNPAGPTQSSWLTVTTRQAPPRGLSPPTVSHLQGRPSEVLVSWSPPLEPNGVLQSYRIQRNNLIFSFSFDSTVLSYTDEDLQPFSEYSYSVIACTSEGCITSLPSNITTLEAPPGMVEPPTVNSITSSSMNITWVKTATQNGEVTEYVLKVNSKEAYRGGEMKTILVNLLPHTSYMLVLLACTSGGCTASATITTMTEEAPPSDMPVPTLKVTGSESVEVSWRPPKNPNGIITGYELRRDGQLIYLGLEYHYHDFTLLPSVEYSYFVRANNSKGAANSAAVTAKTHPAAPAGVGPPLLSPLAANQVKVEWNIPARPNGDIISYTVYHREPIQLGASSTVYTPQDSAFSERYTSLKGLAPYHRYEVRLEACTELGCSSSDWASILTPEAPPAGQGAPLLDLQPDNHTGLQTTFLLTWSPPAQPNGRAPHYQVYRRLENTTDVQLSDTTTLICNQSSTSCKDDGLLPYTAYQYQLWVVNSAGRSPSQWVSGRTGPAPPEGVAPPTFRRVSSTTAVVDMRPPDRPNGVVSLYRVFSLGRNNDVALLSEGTSHQQTLHGLLPYTQYKIAVEACTCYQCCSQGPAVDLRTLAAPPARQQPPRPVTLTSRSAQLAWFEPLEPNGIIESCELHRRTACPQPPQPVSQPCVQGPPDITFFGKRRSYNVTDLQPYSAYELKVACFNNMGSTASNWTAVVTLTEAPQYVSPLLVGSNLTVIWLNWTGSFALNDYLREYTVTESQLRIYSGFHSYLHVPRTSQKALSFQVTCTTDSGSATTPTVRYSPATGLGPVEPEDASKESVSMSAAPIYSELWFILLFALLGLFLLAILLGLLLQRALRKTPSDRDRPPLVRLQKNKKAGGETYTFDTVADRVEINNVTLKSYTIFTEGLSDTKLVGGGSAFNPMSVLRVPRQTELSQTYSHHPLQHSLTQLIDRKAIVTEDGCWDNPLEPAMYVEEDFADTIKSLSCVRKEHATFTDTHL
ncbi:usherin [Stigmatopora nigra]